MFLVKAGTVIQVELPKTNSYFHWSAGWRAYTTKEDKLYDKDEVWDSVAVHNDRDDVPDWARRNITECALVVLQRQGKYALVPADSIEFVN
jgi:hypothetical protein